jgi:hypothetical protein
VLNQAHERGCLRSVRSVDQGSWKRVRDHDLEAADARSATAASQDRPLLTGAPPGPRDGVAEARIAGWGGRCSGRPLHVGDRRHETSNGGVADGALEPRQLAVFRWGVSGRRRMGGIARLAGPTTPFHGGDRSHVPGLCAGSTLARLGSPQAGRS